MKKGAKLPVYECPICAHRWSRAAAHVCPACGFQSYVRGDEPVLMELGRTSSGQRLFAWSPRRRRVRPSKAITCKQCGGVYERIGAHMRKHGGA